MVGQQLGSWHSSVQPLWVFVPGSLNKPASELLFRNSPETAMLSIDIHFITPILLGGCGSPKNVPAGWRRRDKQMTSHRPSGCALRRCYHQLFAARKHVRWPCGSHSAICSTAVRAVVRDASVAAPVRVCRKLSTLPNHPLEHVVGVIRWHVLPRLSHVVAIAPAGKLLTRTERCKIVRTVRTRVKKCALQRF